MNIIKLQVKDFEIIPLEKQYVVENQVNEFAIEFEFDDSWNYETKYVIFDNEETTYKRPIINNQVIIPSELLNGRTTIQIYGQNVEDGEIVKRKPSYKYSFSILNSLSTEGQEESDLPKPTQWEIYISQIETMLDEFTTDYNEFKDDITKQFNDLKEDCETKCDDVIERLAQDEQNIQTNTDNIRTNAESIDALNTSLLDYSLITETGNKISMSINPNTYVITLSLKDKNDNTLSTQSVDLPLETMIVSASYSNGILTFTLKNGQTLQVPIGDLISGLVSTDTFNQAIQSLSNRITTIENDYLKSTDKTELQNQITQNADDIDDIQEEQLTQNADIESLQQENERLSRIVEGLPTKQASGTSFVLNDMVKANIKDYQLRGNTIQDGTPTPDTPVEIQSVKGNQEINVFGKNLFNKNSITNDSWLVENGTVSTEHPGYDVSDYIPIAPNTQYYKGNNGSPRNKYYDINKQPLDTSTYQDISIGGNAGTFTTPNKAYYLRITINEANADINSLQIEQSASATSYEQYSGTTFPISLGTIELNKIGNYQDKIYKQNDKWYLEKNTDKIILDGVNTTFKTFTTYSGFNRCGIQATNNAISDYQEQQNYNYVRSNYFKNVGKASTPETNSILMWNSGNYIYCFFVEGTFENIQQANQWLTTHSMEVIYAIATPTITEITDENLISQLEDIYNIILNENNTIIINGNLPSDTLVIGYADIAKLISSLSSQDNRSVETRKGGKTEPIEEPIETKEEER